MASDHDETPELTATARAQLLRLLHDELDQAYRALDLPADEAVADLRRRTVRLGPPGGCDGPPDLSHDRGSAGDHRI